MDKRPFHTLLLCFFFSGTHPKTPDKLTWAVNSLSNSRAWDAFTLAYRCQDRNAELLQQPQQHCLLHPSVPQLHLHAGADFEVQIARRSHRHFWRAFHLLFLSSLKHTVSTHSFSLQQLQLKSLTVLQVLGVTPLYKKIKAFPPCWEIRFPLVHEWESGNPELSLTMSCYVALSPFSDLVRTTNTQTQTMEKDPLRKIWRLGSYLRAHHLSDSLGLTASPPTCVRFCTATRKGMKNTNR